MICRCGAELEEGKNFCPQCGAKVLFGSKILKHAVLAFLFSTLYAICTFICCIQLPLLILAINLFVFNLLKFLFKRISKDSTDADTSGLKVKDVFSIIGVTILWYVLIILICRQIGLTNYICIFTIILNFITLLLYLLKKNDVLDFIKYNLNPFIKNKSK